MDQRNLGPITAQELEVARKRLIKQIQRIAFQREIEDIKKGSIDQGNNRLLSLNAFINEGLLIRVGGRLKNSELSYSAKHQPILPAHHRLTRLIIKHEHERALHAGPQLTLAFVRSQYWPLGGRRMVRKVVHECVVCFKARPRASKTIMGNLPSARVTSSRPFDNVGVDYCGPVLIKEGKRRNAKTSKAWICIFICMATKAVYIELVSDLSSEGFLNALKRFMGRRGKPSSIFSDNGTNFVGANRELKELYDLFNKEEFQHCIMKETANNVISWHFIQPHAPHFGGLWEKIFQTIVSYFFI
ncbi:uncharacterized protein [Linepithema humile]|uniref:uncharacterized protein n=1 Tax=Linepithema humile TaxID=83485 RepID=UPI00351F5880